MSELRIKLIEKNIRSAEHYLNILAVTISEIKEQVNQIKKLLKGTKRCLKTDVIMEGKDINLKHDIH